MLLSTSFTAKFELVFVLTQENAFFSRGFILKPTERAYVLLKNGTRDFKNRAPFERWTCFLWQSLEIMNGFNTLTLKQTFWKNENFFSWSTKIENATFPFKIFLSEANVKTGRMGCTKWTYRIERIFAGNYFIY